MPVRFDDDAREISCAVRDLVEGGMASPHLGFDLARSRAAALADGRRAHEGWQRERAADDPRFAAEQTLRLDLVVEGWTARLHGRVDGLTEEGGRPVIEEVKSVALDRARLWATAASDWAGYTAQLAIYLWMLASAGQEHPAGRLVLVSVVDGSRHVLGVPLDREAVAARVARVLGRWIRAREERIAWMAARRGRRAPWPFPERRPGQETIARQVGSAVDAGTRLLVQAPTGLGKTAPILVEALDRALATDRQVVWATARTTQQRAILQTARALREAGMPLRVVVVTSRARACAREVVDCRAEVCPFAQDYQDKVDAARAAEGLHQRGVVDAGAARGLADAIVACPYQLAVDAARTADLVICDYNYVFDPDVAGSSLFGEDPERWIAVVDEAHQLVERGRGYGSPAVSRAAVRATLHGLAALGPDFDGVAEVARRIDALLSDELRRAGLSGRGDAEAVIAPDAPAWRALAAAVDAVAVDHAVLRADRAIPASDDPWPDLARAVLRLADGLAAVGEAVVAIGAAGAGEGVRLCCLDPSGLLGPRIARLGGFVACSATLGPLAFYRDLLGLPADRVARIEVPWPFPPEHRRVVVAPRVSTRFADRVAHAPRTAALISSLVGATPGNVAVYFPSFAMLDDLVPRLDLGGRSAIVQRPELSDAERDAALARLSDGGPPVVLAAVLGGVFAEGVDLPAGALRTIVVVGPGLPPVGLERDLLRACYEARYGAGFAYASLIPGLTRVIQAAGRLVRGPDDTGCIALVGMRFRWREVMALLPAWWEPDVPDDPAAAVRTFFANVPGPSR